MKLRDWFVFATAAQASKPEDDKVTRSRVIRSSTMSPPEKRLPSRQSTENDDDDEPDEWSLYLSDSSYSISADSVDRDQRIAMTGCAGMCSKYKHPNYESIELHL